MKRTALLEHILRAKGQAKDGMMMSM